MIKCKLMLEVSVSVRSAHFVKDIELPFAPPVGYVIRGVHDRHVLASCFEVQEAMYDIATGVLGLYEHRDVPYALECADAVFAAIEKQLQPSGWKRG